MAPGGAHPRCALGWKRLGAPSASAPRGEPEQRCWWTCRPGTTSTWRSGCRGHSAAGSAGRPARVGRPSSRRTLAKPARTGIRSARYCFPPAQEPGLRLSGPPEGGRALPRGVVPPEGQRTWGRGPCEGPRLAWSGLVCCASRGGARGQPVVPLRPSLRASRARSGGVFRRAPAWHSPSCSKAGGGSPSRPVAAAPFSSVRHVALAGRAGTARRLPEEAAGSGSCYRQGRTGEGDSGRTPRQENSVPFECSSGTDGHEGPGHRPLRAGA